MRAAIEPSPGSESPTMMPDEIDVISKRPITPAPATIRRSVSDEMATPMTA